MSIGVIASSYDSTGGGANSPIRGVTSAQNNTSSATLALPAGTTTGDYLVLLSGSSYGAGLPSGWRQWFTDGSAAYITGFGAYKVATSTDISAGSVTINFGGTNCGVFLVAINPASALSPSVVTHARAPQVTFPYTAPSATVPSSCYALYAGLALEGGTNNTISTNAGSLVATRNDANPTFAVALYGENMSGAASRAPVWSQSPGTTSNGIATATVEIPSSVNAVYHNSNEMGSVTLMTTSQAEQVISEMDATAVSASTGCNVALTINASMSQSGVAKKLVYRLRDGGLSGTVIATSGTLNPTADTTSGVDTACAWSWVGTVTPTTSRLCVTCEVTSSTSPVYSSLRQFNVWR